LYRKYELQYSNDSVIYRADYNNDTLRNTWVETSRTNYVYTKDSIILHNYILNQNTNNWTLYYDSYYRLTNGKITCFNQYYYNQSAYLSSIYTFEYEGELLKRFKVSTNKYEYLYNNNTVAELKTYRYNYNLKKYTWQVSTTYKYANNLPSELLYCNIQNEKDTLPAYGKMIYQYDANNNLKRYLYYRDETTNTLISYSSDEFLLKNGYLIQYSSSKGEKVTYEYEVGKGNISIFKDIAALFEFTPVPR